MQTPRPEICEGRRGTPRTLPVRLRRWAMWRPMNSEQLRMRSRPRGRQRLTTTAWRPAKWSVGGSAPNSPTRSVSLCSTTRGCATTCAGSLSTADTAHAAAAPRPHFPGVCCSDHHNRDSDLRGAGTSNRSLNGNGLRRDDQAARACGCHHCGQRHEHTSRGYGAKSIEMEHSKSPGVCVLPEKPRTPADYPFSGSPDLALGRKRAAVTGIVPATAAVAESTRASSGGAHHICGDRGVTRGCVVLIDRPAPGERGSAVHADGR
jgi:hypothetical protein